MTMQPTPFLLAVALATVAGCGPDPSAATIASLERELAELRARGASDPAVQADLAAARDRAFTLEQEVRDAKARWASVEEQLAVGEKALDAAHAATKTSRELRESLGQALAVAERAVTERDAALVARAAAVGTSDDLVNRLATLAAVVGFKPAPDEMPDPAVVRAELERFNARLEGPVAAGSLTCETLLRALALERADARDLATTLRARVAELEGR